MDIRRLEWQLAYAFPETVDRYVDVVRRNEIGYYIALRHESLAVLSEQKVPFHANDFPILEYRHVR